MQKLGRAAVVLLAASLLGGCGYGRIHELDEAALRGRSEIEVQLRRRAELVPNLLETVQSYGSVSGEVIAAVADARASLVSAMLASDLSGMEEWSAELSAALGDLLAASSRINELRNDPAYHLLRSQLEQTEERIAGAGEAYNLAVSRYNEYIAGFPQMVTAKVIGAGRLEPWERPGLPATPAGADE